MTRLILLLFCLFSPPVVFAQGPPITTETPIMLGLEGSGIRTFGKFISKENANIYVQAIGVPFNFTSKFQVGGMFPFKFINPNGAKTTSGFADITVFAKYQLYKKDETAKTFRILANLKQTFPTGKTTSATPIGLGVYQT